MSDQPSDGASLRLQQLVLNRPRTSALILLLLTAAAGVPASRLRPQTELVELLPEDSRAALAFRDYLARFRGFEKVYVVVRGGEAETLLEAAWALEEELSGRPGVAAARSGLKSSDEEFLLRFVAPRAALLLPSEDWLETVEARITEAAVRERVATIRRRLASPVGSVAAPLLRADPLGLFDELPLAAAGVSGLPFDPLTGTFLSPGSDAALVIISPSAAELDAQGGRRLQVELAAAFDRVRARVSPDLDFLAAGGPLYAAEDERVIRRDMTVTLTTSVLACGLVLVATFGELWLPLVLVLAVAAGQVWLAAVLVLSGVSVFGLSLGFASVLVGLGIDYGIHTSARYREWRLLGRDAPAAWMATLRHVGTAVVASAATTATAFLVLLASGLAPLRQVGMVVGVGILAILLSSVLLCGALFLSFPQRIGVRPAGPLWRWLGRLVDGLVDFAERRAPLVLAAAGLLCAVSLLGISRLHLSTDLRDLRPSDHPVVQAEGELARSFGVGLVTAMVVVSGEDLNDALDRGRGVARVLRSGVGTGGYLSSPADWLASSTRIAERLEQLARLPLESAARLLERELQAANLDPAAFGTGLAALRSLGRGQDPGAPTQAEWPDWLADGISQEGASATGRAWLVAQLQLEAGAWPDGPPSELERALEEAAPGARVASSNAVAGELRRLARRDLRVLAGLALGGICVLVVLSFRGRLLSAGLAFVPVTLGALWTLGAIGLLSGTLDLVGLMLVPVLLGIGIDDGLHTLHGAEGPLGRRRVGLAASVRASGRALFLTTLTAAVGFTSLALSSLPGLRRGGLAMGAGVLLCLLATVLVLPALERLGAFRQNPSRGSRP